LVAAKSYIPECGDVAWLNFNPQAGHEHSGRRPALVISPSLYNSKTGLALFCPITSIEKGYPFEVKLPDNSEVKGVILADQVKSLDWRSRDAKFVFKIPDDLIKETVNKIKALLNL
jgi:mRNA interferase MazF